MERDKNKWLDYSGTELLWDRIRKRYDKKLDRVVSQDDSVRVISNNRIAVQVSGAKDNILQLNTIPGEKGLYVPRPTQHKLKFGMDQEYIYDGSEDVTVPVYMGDVEK